MRKICKTVLDCTSRYSDNTAFSIIENGDIFTKKYADFIIDIMKAKKVVESINENRIAVIGWTSYAWICFSYAVIFSGKNLIIPDATLQREDILELLKISDANYAIITDESLGIDDFLKENMIECIGVSRNSIEVVELSKDFIPQDIELPIDNKIICFTSGTSKLAKGVVLSEKSLEYGLKNAASTIEGGLGDKIFIPLPTYHIFGFMLVMESLYKGQHICFGQGVRNVKKDIMAFQPKSLVAVPSILEFLIKCKKIPDSVMHVMTAGSKCSMDIYMKLREMGIRVQNGYGLSEVCGGIAISMNNDPVDKLTPCDYTDIIINDDGEITVRYEGIMEGYYNNPNAVKEAFYGEYFATGDLGYMDDDGCIHITGRKKDIIVLENGEKVNCLEIDNILSCMKGVKEGAIKDNDKEISVVIVLEDDYTQDYIDRQIEEYNNKQPVFRRIKNVEYTNEPLPRTSSGKLIRRKLY